MNDAAITKVRKNLDTLTFQSIENRGVRLTRTCEDFAVSAGHMITAQEASQMLARLIGAGWQQVD